MLKITLTEDEVLNGMNYTELGEYVRNKFWQERRNIEGPPVDDEHVILNIGDDGLVRSIGNAWICSICGEKTDKIDYDYLVGYDHLACKLKTEI